ncbi:MAG: TolC family protein [Prosthecobacter sp.]|nr:TolC family protein [Prosthecobacter sp.]
MKIIFCPLLLCLCLPAFAADKPAPISIERLVANTLAANPELKFYEAEIMAAKAGRRTAGKLPNPELSFEVGRLRVGGSNFGAEGLAYAATLAQPIEWPGRLGLRKAIANGDIVLADLGFARFRNYLANRVRILGYSLALHQQNAAAAAEVADRFAAVRDVLVQREPAGITPLLETRIIEAAAVGVQRRASEASVTMQKTLLELNQLLGRRADTPLVVERAEFKLQSQPSIPALLTQAAMQNFDLRVRRAELEQQGLKVALAENERHPTFTVGPTISGQRAGERESMIGVAVSVPLPFWKSGKADVATAEARRVQAEATLNAALRETERKVTEAALVLKIQWQRLADWKAEAVVAFSEAAGLADRHYRLGAVPVSSYLEMQDRYLEAVEAINATKLEALQAALEVEQLVGAAEPLALIQTSTK